MLGEDTGDDSETLMALKVEAPPCPWEFYIGRVLHGRMASMVGADRFLQMRRLHLETEASFLFTSLGTHGTLHDLVNLYRIKGQAVRCALWLPCVLLSGLHTDKPLKTLSFPKLHVWVVAGPARKHCTILCNGHPGHDARPPWLQHYPCRHQAGQPADQAIWVLGVLGCLQPGNMA